EIRKAGYDLSSMRRVERRDYVIECNWKVYVDNYLEGYHLPIAHPGLFKELDYDQYRVETFRYYSKQHAPIRELKPGEVPGRDPAGGHRGLRAGSARPALAVIRPRPFRGQARKWRPSLSVAGHGVPGQGLDAGARGSRRAQPPSVDAAVHCLRSDQRSGRRI